MLRSMFWSAALFGVTLSVQGGPAPYGSAKIYIVSSERPLVEEIRRQPDLVMEVKEGAIVDWFAALHWEKHRHDTSIKDRAKPVLMLIDLFHRVRPQSPAPPAVDTLYCSSKYAYSLSGDYVDISRLVSKKLLFPILH